LKSLARLTVCEPVVSELGERRLSLRNEVRDWVRAFRPQLRFCLRATVAALVALAIANSLNFPLHGSWMVLTAVVVTQVSVGGSLRATLDYVVGTLAGAVYAAAVGLLVPHVTALGQAVALALAVAPLALAAALRPSFRVAPFSAVLVLLIGGALGENPVMSALVRVLEVALGGAVAAAVSMLVLYSPNGRTNWESKRRRGFCATRRAFSRRSSAPSRRAPI
jgi:uncharacterized membrane protein YccC